MFFSSPPALPLCGGLWWSCCLLLVVLVSSSSFSSRDGKDPPILANLLLILLFLAIKPDSDSDSDSGPKPLPLFGNLLQLDLKRPYNTLVEVRKCRKSSLCVVDSASLILFSFSCVSFLYKKM